MSEWLKEHAWKACRVGRLSQVRILSLPPGSKNSMFQHRVFTFLQEKWQDMKRSALALGSLSSGARLSSCRFRRAYNQDLKAS